MPKYPIAYADKWSRNEITGDPQRTKPSTELYRENYDKIFRKPKPEQPSGESNEQELRKL
jgi:hypothetical protein